MYTPVKFPLEHRSIIAEIRAMTSTGDFITKAYDIVKFSRKAHDATLKSF